MQRPAGVDPRIYKLAQRLSSVTLMGPPMSDKVIRLVEHLFTPEEAAVAVGVPNYFGKGAGWVARRLKRDVADIQPHLDTMSAKRIIVKTVKDGNYALLPIVPGMFEMAMMRGEDDPWHRRYAELFEDLFSTGYVREMAGKFIPGVKSIPVEASLPGESRVLSSDRFSELMDQHKEFAVITVCQCRQVKHLTDKKCARSKPEDGCLVFGSFAQGTAQNGTGRMVSREEMRSIAIERREKGLVFFTGNVKFSSPNAICTCCDCCCDFLRSVNEFGAIGFVAPPHYIARVDESLCSECGKCVKKCNTHAHTLANKKHLYDKSKCIGCGNCIDSCKEKAIQMVNNPAHKKPYESFLSMGIRLLPKATMAAITTKLARSGRI